ncbi:type VII secretion target [Kitasatospora sp. NPDC058190]|uniref:type VII secretion target n=1 Tax=Kitasatospora sp. NPDC058190 TaxID=3346371 RepID=UPI0036DA9EC2
MPSRSTAVSAVSARVRTTRWVRSRRGLPGFGVGAACKDASGTWDKQVEALSKVIGGLAQNLRTTAKGYRDAEAEAVRSFEQNGG